MDEGKSIGVNLIWAITILMIVSVIGGAIYYSGGLNPVQDKKIDVKVDVPDVTK